MNKILLPALLGLALAVSPLFAGPESLPSGKEMKQVAPAPAPECNWAGFYIGLNVGGQFGHSEDVNEDRYELRRHSDHTPVPWGYSESGVVAGGQIGYNFQWHWLVVGPEIDVGYMNLDGRGSEKNSAGGDIIGESDSDFFTTFRGRIGVALDCWLIYATGGAIGVNYDTRVVDTCDTGNCGGDIIDAHKQEFDWGYTVGGGFERMINRHWSIKAEYLYYSLDDQSFSGVDTDFGRFIGVFSFRGETTGHIVRAGLNYKF